MWTMEEREEINEAIMHEEDLHQLAYKAYDEAKEQGKKLKEILVKKEYKPLTDYYSYNDIVNNVLKYHF